MFDQVIKLDIDSMDRVPKHQIRLPIEMTVTKKEKIIKNIYKTKANVKTNQ